MYLYQDMDDLLGCINQSHCVSNTQNTDTANLYHQPTLAKFFFRTQENNGQHHDP
jgi:hypothetical protein